MKIYTKGGDQGKTSLFSGKRVLKSELRIEAYGTIDELNSFTGALRSLVQQAEITEQLHRVQWHLFSLGSWLAAVGADTGKLPVLEENEILFLENAIDIMETSLEPMKNFILPAGSQAVSAAHICRTVCRRAERRCVGLAQEDKIPEHTIVYLNRLSDYFFVLARYLAKLSGIPETPWKPHM